MKKIIIDFMRDHFQRLVFSLGVLVISEILYVIGEKQTALTLTVGVATLWMNKARSPKEEGEKDVQPTA